MIHNVVHRVWTNRGRIGTWHASSSSASRKLAEKTSIRWANTPAMGLWVSYSGVVRPGVGPSDVGVDQCLWITRASARLGARLARS